MLFLFSITVLVVLIVFHYLFLGIFAIIIAVIGIINAFFTIRPIVFEVVLLMMYWLN